MDLRNLTDIQPVAPAVNGCEEPALDVDRALLREGSGLQRPVKRGEYSRLILPGTRIKFRGTFSFVRP